MQTIRQKMIDILSLHEMDARQLSGLVGIRENEIIEHLSHIARSLAIKGKKLTIRPAECLGCGYVFKKRQRFTRPSRCPLCKKTHLQSPEFYITNSA